MNAAQRERAAVQLLEMLAIGAVGDLVLGTDDTAREEQGR